MKRMILIFVLLLPILISAQWSDDPAVNNAICDLTGEQAIPKIGIGPTNDIYISWFSNDSGNYDVRLQRLDAEGNELWEHNGILISDNPAMTWLTDWDMTVDQENHAVLTFQDIRNAGNNNVYAYRISPEGNFIWGEDGIELSNSTAFDVAPKVAITSANNAVITWQSDSVIIMQKISPSGELLWGDDGITLSNTNDLTWPQPMAVDNDAILLKYFEDSGPPYSPTRHVYLQRYDTDGNSVWTEPTVVSNAGGISAWTQIFSMVPDNDNGCFIVWHDDRDNNMDASSFIQHINADGSVAFTPNGVELSLQQSSEKFYPDLVYQENEDAVYISWFQTNSNQDSYGISAQKLDSSGNRIWGDNGIDIFPISTLYLLPFAARKAEDDLIIFYEESTDGMNSQLKATRIDQNGDFVWNQNSATICSVNSEKVHTVASSSFETQIVASWEDDRNGAKDIYAQNINFDGTLGLTAPNGYIEGYVALNGGIGNLEEVQITCGSSTVNPDETGFFSISLAPGIYELEASLEYYETVTVAAIEVLSGSFTTLSEPVELDWIAVFNPPQNCSVDPETGEVSWDIPEPYPGAVLIGYELYLDDVLITNLTQTVYTLEDLTAGQIYTVGITAVYEQGESDPVTLEFTYNGTSAGEDLVANKLMLSNYPNPFNPSSAGRSPSTTISFNLSNGQHQQNEKIELEIYNIKGQKVKTLECINRVDTKATESLSHSVTWNGKNEHGKTVSSGLYYYKLNVGKDSEMKKMLLIK